MAQPDCVDVLLIICSLISAYVEKLCSICRSSQLHYVSLYWVTYCDCSLSLELILKWVKQCGQTV